MTSAAGGEFKRKRVWPVAFALVALLAVPGRASATVLTYVPSANPSGSNNDLGDLSLAKYYAWTISNLDLPAKQSIISASITFTTLYNWDTIKNNLYLDMFDAAVPAANGDYVMSGLNGTANNGANQDVYDSMVRSAPDAAGSAGDAFDSANLLMTGLKTDLGGTTQWSVKTGSGGKYIYTYNFTESQFLNLQAYISNNRDVTLALDPDLFSFANEGVSFAITTGTPNPEPASLILLGTGLLLSVNQYRRRKKSAK